MSKKSLMFRIFQNIVFKMGDLRWVGWKHFPIIVTWNTAYPEIDLNEVMAAVKKLQPGDVILHRENGYFGNMFIGYGMTHAGLYIGENQVIEAISEGVIKRHAGHILYADIACVLRPNLDPFAYPWIAKNACNWAHKIIGFPYDVLFDFNTAKEKELIEKGTQHAIKAGVKFCCSEIPFFCYMDEIIDLNLKCRRNVTALTKILHVLGLHAGEFMITPDMYMTANFNLVWCSHNLTPSWCKKQKRSQEYLKKVQTYWENPDQFRE